MTGAEPSDVGVVFRVVNEEALRTPCDVLLMKYAQVFDGSVRAALRLLQGKYPAVTLQLPKTGDFSGPYEVPASPIPGPSRICFVGIKPPTNFLYRDVEEFGLRALATLAGAAPATETVGVTLLGQGYGLDDLSCLDAQLQGMLTSLQSGDAPAPLREIVFVERDPRRARRLQEHLDDVRRRRDPVPANDATNPSGAVTTLTSQSRPTAFVAMPFSSDFNDVFTFGIQQVLRDLGFKCERMDRESYVGDVLAEIRRRISRSRLVVADLSHANPNVYLEVGYAWASEVPTVLVFRPVKQGEDLEFNTRGQRALLYGSIDELADRLRTEVEALRQQGLI